MGLLVVLVCFIVIVFGLTVVKVQTLGDIRQFEAFDHAPRPQIVPAEGGE